MKAAKRIIVNTGILYGRMLLTIGVSLYSTRLILNALGSIDYGIFNLIAGVIALLAFLNTAMAASTQRYLSFYQGKNDIETLKKIFRNSFFLHIVIGVFVVIGIELLGLFLFDGFLNIPADRIESAKGVYHFMSVAVFFSIVAVPFTALLNAHEKMIWIAVVSIVEASLKLVVALALLKVQSDRLILYGLLTAGIGFVTMILQLAFCLKNYEECSIAYFWRADKELIKELTFFAGWNLFGTLCALGRTQGLAVLLNLFFGAIVNAAYGIANQVAGQLSFFSVTMLQVLNPQIVKSEGTGDRDRMLYLSMIASKFCFFLLCIIAIPCIFEMNIILSLWLKNVPEYTLAFCRLILIGALVNQLTIGLQSGLQATGKIKYYQIVVGSLLLFNLPVAYLLLKSNFPVYSVLVCYILIEFVACCLRLFFLMKVGGLVIAEYLKRVTMREIIPVAINVSICLLIVSTISAEYRFIMTFACSGVAFLIGIYYTGLCFDEKSFVDNILLKGWQRLKIN